MRTPKLGKQTFLTDNTERILSYEKFYKEIYNSPSGQTDVPLYTGRYLVINLFPDEGNKGMRKVFEKKAGFRVASSNDYKTQSDHFDDKSDADIFIYEGMGIALMSGEDDQIKLMEASVDESQIIIPEKIVYVPNDIPMAVNMAATWGINATKTVNSTFTGNDVKIAVLDTGFDLGHPDFNGRQIISKSFVPNELVNDQHGHGTHCIGVACGGSDANGVRYGVASNSTIFAGKVLSNAGSGAQSWILDGIEWAVQNKCNIISMSLGSPVYPGQGYDLAYENAAKYATENGTLVIAAAGNESRRSRSLFQPIGSPADCPSVLAIGAVNNKMDIADFSCRSINPGTNIDFVAPGVNTYSSWPMPMRYRSISGTSMATPHVAGIAALLFEKYPAASPAQIVQYLKQLSNKLSLPIIDAGNGFVIAP